MSIMRWSNSLGTTPQDAAAEVVVNATSRDALLVELEHYLLSRKRFSVATLNLDHITKLRNLPAFRRAYLQHSHVTADGNPIVWLSRLAGQNVSLVPGSELIDPICDLAARMDVPVAFLGSSEDTLSVAAQKLSNRHNGLQVALTLAPPIGFDPEGADADACIARLGASGARICFLALGAPKQEIFAARASTQLADMGFVSIGAGLDFISGQQVRAPRLVRRFAGEWLWRLAHDPRRLAARYGMCLAILPGLFGRALICRMQTGRTAAE